MPQIVAFPVPSREAGEEALERLEGVVIDAALIYKNKHDRVKIQQTSDMTVGKGLVRGGVLGAVVSIFAGPLVGVTLAGGALGGAYGALRDKGIDDKVMKLAGKQLESGGAAIFVLADDGTAKQIIDKVKEAGITDVEIGSFDAESEGIVREVLKVS